jgi:SNF2 family DNA or RNA helicase
MSQSLADYDVILTTYGTLRRDVASQGPLLTTSWARVVLDEAHHIRNRKTQLFTAACKLKANFRWCLSGTPIHNSLDDYGALLAFLEVWPFVDKTEFADNVTKPVQNDESDSLEKLRKLISATCLRRTKMVLSAKELHLPQRHEETKWVELSTTEQKLYDFFLQETSRIMSGLAKDDPDNIRPFKVGGEKDIGVLSLLNFLRRICDHGEDMLPESALKAWRGKQSGGITWDMMQSSQPICSKCGRDPDETAACIMDEGRSEACPECVKTLKELKKSARSARQCALGETIEPSSKVKALLENLTQISGKRQAPPPRVSLPRFPALREHTDQPSLQQRGLQLVDTHA